MSIALIYRGTNRPIAVHINEGKPKKNTFLSIRVFQCVFVPCLPTRSAANNQCIKRQLLTTRLITIIDYHIWQYHIIESRSNNYSASNRLTYLHNRKTTNLSYYRLLYFTQSKNNQSHLTIGFHTYTIEKQPIPILLSFVVLTQSKNNKYPSYYRLPYLHNLCIDFRIEKL